MLPFCQFGCNASNSKAHVFPFIFELHGIIIDLLIWDGLAV
jgi:hypothetical protein